MVPHLEHNGRRWKKKQAEREEGERTETKAREVRERSRGSTKGAGGT